MPWCGGTGWRKSLPSLQPTASRRPPPVASHGGPPSGTDPGSSISCLDAFEVLRIDRPAGLVPRMRSPSAPHLLAMTGTPGHHRLGQHMTERSRRSRPGAARPGSRRGRAARGVRCCRSGRARGSPGDSGSRSSPKWWSSIGGVRELVGEPVQPGRPFLAQPMPTNATRSGSSKMQRLVDARESRGRGR